LVMVRIHIPYRNKPYFAITDIVIARDYCTLTYIHQLAVLDCIFKKE
jgi:hypothetical protein